MTRKRKTTTEVSTDNTSDLIKLDKIKNAINDHIHHGVSEHETIRQIVMTLKADE